MPILHARVSSSSQASPPFARPSDMAVQGQLLQINVVGCRNLRDKEWMSRQDPYVVLEYAGTRYRTKTDTDGGRNPCFNEKLTIPLVEGLREVNVQVLNSNTITFDDFIGSGKIQLHEVLLSRYDDSTWSLMSKRGKYAGEVRTIMHIAGAKNQYSVPLQSALSYQVPPPTAPPYAPPYQGFPPTAAPYQRPPPTAPSQYPEPAGYTPPPPSSYAPYPYPAYPPAYSYGPSPSGYPPYGTPPAPYGTYLSNPYPAPTYGPPPPVARPSYPGY